MDFGQRLYTQREQDNLMLQIVLCGSDTVS